MILTVVFASTFEAACRFEDWIEYRTPLFARERSQSDLLIRDALGMHGRSGGRFQKWILNSFGMRGPEIAAAKTPDVLRIVTAGASETFGLYESPGKEYPRQLEDSLNARLATNRRDSCEPRHAQVLNAAMPGMSLPTIDQDLRLRVRRLAPDLVVIYPTPAGYLEENTPKAARPDSSDTETRRLPRRYALYPRAWVRVRSQIKLFLPTALQDWIRQREITADLLGHGPAWRFDSLPSARLTSYDTQLRQAVGTIRLIGAIPILMTHANRFVGRMNRQGPALRSWEKFYPRASGEMIVAFDSAARLSTIAVARDSGAALIDLAPSLARAAGEPFADYAHFTDLGAGITAGVAKRAIFATLEQHLWTSCSF